MLLIFFLLNDVTSTVNAVNATASTAKALSKYSEIEVITIDDAKAGIRLYPNPVRNYLSVVSTIPMDLSGATITVLDATGKATLKQALSPVNEQQITISQLARGIYIVHILKKEGIVTFKY